MKRYSLTLIAIAHAGMLLAANTNTVAPGTWNTGGNWSSGVPGGTDDATVNHVMVINSNIATTRGDYIINERITDLPEGTAYNLNLSGTGGNNGNFVVNATATFEGTLMISSHGILTIRSFDTLVVGATTFANGSVVNIEPNGVLVINGNLTNNNNSDEIVVDGLIIVNGNVTGGNGSEISGNGGLSATGSVITSGSGSIFGSTDDCISGPCGLGGSTLPIVLKSFNATRDGNVVTLNWITLSEINNDFFTIERADDELNFEPIIFIDGAGNSRGELKYMSVDAEPLNGTTYYRLKQTDFDGRSAYSEVVVVGGSQLKEQLMFYPVPTSDLVYFRFKDQADFSGYAIIIDATGRVMDEQKVDNNKQVNMISYPRGFYLVELRDNDNQLRGTGRVVRN